MTLRRKGMAVLAPLTKHVGYILKLRLRHRWTAAPIKSGGAASNYQDQFFTKPTLATPTHDASTHAYNVLTRMRVMHGHGATSQKPKAHKTY